MSRKTENVVCRASYCKVFSTIFLVSDFFNSHACLRLHRIVQQDSLRFHFVTVFNFPSDATLTALRS